MKIESRTTAQEHIHVAYIKYNSRIGLCNRHKYAKKIYSFYFLCTECSDLVSSLVCFKDSLSRLQGVSKCCES